MLRSFRNSLRSWFVRLFFFLLAVAFGLWGIGDVLRGGMGNGAAATVGDQRIDAAELQEAYRRQMQQVSRMLGDKQPTPEMRNAVARQALEQLVTQAALIDTAHKMGLAVPDPALRDAVMALPAFQNQAGQFERNQMEAVLSNNGLSEQRFVQMMRDDLLIRQLVDTVGAGVVAPDTLVREAYQASHEQRVGEIVSLPFAAAPNPPAPDEADLRRWWENHPDLYSTPAYRRVRAIVLSPETVERSIEVSDADLRAWFDQHKAEFGSPARRSLEIVMTHDKAVADKLAAQWRGGADWAALTDAAGKDGAAPTTMTDTTEGELVDPALGKAVFAAPEGQVVGPVETGLGTALFRVTRAVPGADPSFDQVRDQVRARVVREKATDLVYDRANKVEDLLAGGARLDEMPSDLGLAGVQGTLDAQGNTRDGTKAPIPGGDALRAALVQTAFESNPGDPPRLVEAPDHSYYAVSVEQVEPAHVEPFDQVRDKVLADWTRDRRRHEQEETATKLMMAARAGTPLADAAREAGLAASRTPPVGRNAAPPPGVPAALIGPLFGLKKGDATMVETPEGFTVETLADTIIPDPAADPAGLAAMREQLGRALTNDYQLIYASAVRARGNARINPKVVADVAEP